MVILKKSFLLISLILLTALTSCQEEEFGYNSFEIAYKTNFEKQYGKIKPDQIWDFSSYNLRKLGLVGGPSYAMKTRATRANASTEGVVFNPNHDQMPGFGPSATTGNNKDNQTDGGNQYYNDNKLSGWLSRAPTGTPQQVVFEHPTASFTIVPVGQNSGDWELHMVDMGNGNDYNITNQTNVNRAFVILPGRLVGDIYFYLTLKDGSKTEEMVIFTPDNQITHALDGNPCIVLGCETNGSVNYKDLGLLIVVPQVKQEEGEEVIETLYPVDVVSKKYMMEDRGSTADFDFNDIVVLVERVHRYCITTTNKGSYIDEISTKSYAKLVYLCGTIPFTLTIGNQSFGPLDGRVEYVPTVADGYGELASETGAEVSNDIIDSNDIKLTVENGTSSGLTYAFPETGAMPLMIAVDKTVECSPENESVSRQWFELNVKQQTEVVITE